MSHLPRLSSISTLPFISDTPPPTPPDAVELASLTLAPSDVTVVLYHRSCTDGLAAAFAAHTLLGGSAEYIALSPGEPPPLVRLHSACVAIFDVPFGPDALADVAAVAESYVLLDCSTRAALFAPLPRECCFFDHARCAAMLAWQYFHRGCARSDVPPLIRYIQDVVMKEGKLSDAADFAAGLKAVKRLSFQVLATLLDPDELARLLSRGSAVRAYIDAEFARSIPTASFVVFHGYEAAILNGSANVTELADELASLAPIGIVYYYNHASSAYKVWLRTQSDDIDVAALAGLHNGGGSSGSASFTFRPNGPSSIHALFSPSSSFSPSAPRSPTTPPTTRAPPHSDGISLSLSPPPPPPSRPPPSHVAPAEESSPRPILSQGAPITPVLPSMSTMASMLDKRLDRQQAISPPLQPASPSLPNPDEEEISMIQDKVIHHMTVPHDLVGFLLGKRGCGIKAIRAESGALIVIQNRGDVAKSALGRRVTLSGTPVQVERGSVLIAARLTEGRVKRHR